LNNENSVRWRNRHDLLECLDETILNVLNWSDIPVDVGEDAEGSNSVFVADDHFSVSSREESVPIVDDPTPRLEAEQDHLLMTVLRDMTTSDQELVEEVATDGGQHVDDLAESSGYSLSTIYRALQRLDGVIESRQGHVRFVSQKIAEEIRGIVQSTEHAIESAADRAAKLFDIDVNQSSNSAVSRWLAEYGAQWIPPEDVDGRGKIRIDTIMSEFKSSSRPKLQEALDFLYHAWITDGRDRVDVNRIIIEADLANGKSVAAPLGTLR
jgi:transposase